MKHKFAVISATALCIVALSLGLLSCGSDKDDEPDAPPVEGNTYGPEKLNGTWMLAKSIEHKPAGDVDILYSGGKAPFYQYAVVQNLGNDLFSFDIFEYSSTKRDYTLTRQGGSKIVGTEVFSLDGQKVGDVIDWIPDNPQMSGNLTLVIDWKMEGGWNNSKCPFNFNYPVTTYLVWAPWWRQ